MTDRGHIEGWTADEVVEFLASLDLDQYSDDFMGRSFAPSRPCASVDANKKMESLAISSFISITRHCATLVSRVLAID
jgi:hypothetical protein